MVQGTFVAALALRDQSFLDASTREIERILLPKNASREFAYDSTPLSPPSEPEPPVASRRRTHRDRLLDKGIELLFERGYHGMTVDALLAAAQVPKGSFYHHFGSKEAFTLAVLDNYDDFHRKTLAAWVSGHDELPTALRLRGYYDELVAIFVASGFRRSDLAGKLATEVATTSEPLRSTLATLIRQWRSQLEVVLAEGRLRGDVRADVSVEDQSAALLSLINGAFVVSSSTRDTVALDSVADAIVAVVTP
ncbi:TetR/AcrR family transcriptional regulator [Gordonia sp. TBRC 11910]|uniref:TetR/AcrR family transcriptional regulator n=2 Tax=Gordonia asplenii TaxID=2725283 RepID=A0A848L201_9ACTN|nr:TetR/AcrR family transcriptional regulator [Gordonia asplenii]